MPALCACDRCDVPEEELIGNVEIAGSEGAGDDAFANTFSTCIRGVHMMRHSCIRPRISAEISDVLTRVYTLAASCGREREIETRRAAPQSRWTMVPSPPC